MPPTQITLDVEDGTLAALDFGGSGVPVLLVHGSGHNAAAWGDVATRLLPHCHPVAIDLRGHGQTPLDSADAEHYWRDLGGVVRSLGWRRPVLVGHSTGGYAVTVATAAGLVDAAALCVVDGVVLDDRETAAASHAGWRTPEAMDRLRAMFRYGWVADDGEMDDYVEACVRQADGDWLNAGARLDLVRAVTRRSFVRHGPGWLRRPTTEEIITAASPDFTAKLCPAIDLYEQLNCPLTVVVARRGFYAERRAQVQTVVAAGPERVLVHIESNHNVPMTSPDELAGIIVDVLGRV